MSAPSKNKSLRFLWKNSNGDYLNPNKFAEGTIVYNKSLDIKYNSLYDYINWDDLDIHHKLIYIYLHPLVIDYRDYYQTCITDHWEFINNNKWARLAILSNYYTNRFIINSYENINSIKCLEKDIKEIPISQFVDISYKNVRSISLEDIRNRIIPYPTSGDYHLFSSMTKKDKSIIFKITSSDNLRSLNALCSRESFSNQMYPFLKLSGKHITIKMIEKLLEDPVIYIPGQILINLQNETKDDNIKKILEPYILANI